MSTTTWLTNWPEKQDEMETYMETKKQKVQKLLKSRKWYTSTELDRAAGGSKESGTRAARRLREEGYILKTRRTLTGTEYRIAGTEKV